MTPEEKLVRLLARLPPEDYELLAARDDFEEILRLVGKAWHVPLALDVATRLKQAGRQMARIAMLEHPSVCPSSVKPLRLRVRRRSC